MNKAEKERSKKIEKIVRIICKSDLNAMAFTRWHTETVMIAQRKLAVLIVDSLTNWGGLSHEYIGG